MKKWSRVAASESPDCDAQPKDPNHPVPVPAFDPSIKKYLRGKDESVLYGVVKGNSNNLSSLPINQVDQMLQPTNQDYLDSTTDTEVACPETDFRFWNENTLDPKTGRTKDSKILYDTGGQDRGVCRDALLGRTCVRGSQCPFSHPIRQSTRVGKDICLGISELSVRHLMSVGDSAIVRICDVVSPFLFSVMVVDYCVVDKLDSTPLDNIPRDPDGLWQLITDMSDFYSGLQQSDDQTLSYRSLECVTDVFVAVQWNFQDELHWFRGIVVDQCEANSGVCLKVNLPDIGRLVTVFSAKLIRRLDNGFLREPWFAVRLGLGKIRLPISGSFSPATLSWFRDILADKVCYVEVVDEECDLPLVELFIRLDDGWRLSSLNDFLVEKMVVSRRELRNEPFDHDSGPDESSEDDEKSLVIFPG